MAQVENAEPAQGTLMEKLVLQTRTGRKPIHKVLMDNFVPGLTVSLVSVPLSISLGIASVSGDDPAAPIMGVATAFWGGLTAGLFGSSDLNIVGPAGALSGMLNSYTIQFNGAGVLPYISMISAGWCFLVWFLNLQRYLLLMPKAVFEGFTTSVAIIIGLNQLGMAFDLPPRPKHEHFYENVIESFKVIDHMQPAPTIFFLVSAILLLGLVKWVPKVKGVSIPWTVLIPVTSLLFGYLSNTNNLGGIVLPTLKDKYGLLKQTVAELPEHSLSYHADGNWAGILTASFGVAFVAVLETLISAKIAEQKMDWTFDDSRENLGLVVAHAVCGITGALPPTGVFVRTSLNMQLGATHRLSQIMNAIWVFIISVVAMPVFSYLPQSAVAALLIFASARMAPKTYIRELWINDKGSFFLLMVTCAICVFMDPVYGLIVGMVLALLRDAAETAGADSRLTVASDGELAGQKARSIEKTEEEMDINGIGKAEWSRATSGGSVRSMRSIRFDQSAGLMGSGSPIEKMMRLLGKKEDVTQPLDYEEGKTLLYEPVGPVVYLAADKHVARMKSIIALKPSKVIVSLELATRVDMDGSEALDKGIKTMKGAGIDVQLVLPENLFCNVLGRAKWVRVLKEKGNVHEHRRDAIKFKGEAPADQVQSGSNV